jgi:pimeloyl-ACP methyl ester carboxylesterase
MLPVMKTHRLAMGAALSVVQRPGTEPPTVFIHGLAASSDAFAQITPQPGLAGTHSILPDLLGFGRSDRPDTFGYTIEDHSEVVVELLTSVEPNDLNIVGHSLGGAIAVLVAEAMPDRVSAIVLAEANLDPGGGGMSLPVARRSEDDYVAVGYERNLQSMTGPERDMMMQASPVAIHRTSRSLVANTEPTIRHRLLQLDIPRTFIVGARSLAAPALPSGESGDELEEHGIRRIVVPDAGHSMMFENPAGFAAAVSGALRAP